MEQLHGLLVVNKPRGMSSAQCTNRLKRLGQRKIGHAGTLDPMAQGVLLVLLGQATKISGHLMAGGEKRYAAVVEFGRITDTWDDDGATVAALDDRALRQQVLERPDFEAALRAEVASWSGEMRQVVPAYSAAKHEGRPLYSLARAGHDIPEKVKTIHILQAEVLWVDLPRAAFRVVCSSGTYIRSLAHSLGTRMGCGAVLMELIREYSHPFGLENAVSLDSVTANPELLRESVLPITAALPDWPVLQVTLDDEVAVRHGMPLADGKVMWQGKGAASAWQPGVRAILVNGSGEPLALAEASDSTGYRAWNVLRGLWA